MYTLDQLKLNHFTGRLYDTKVQKDESFERQFGIVGDTTPRTAEEIADRIKSGKYVIAEKTGCYSGSWFEHFIWRDPSIKKDQAGYEAAYDALTSAHKLATDALYTTPADGAKIVADFQAWTYTAPAAPATA